MTPNMATLMSIMELPRRIGLPVSPFIQALHALMEGGKGETGRVIRVGMFETAAFLMGQHIATYQIMKY